jgi:predicted nucleic acid-binding protein
LAHAVGAALVLIDDCTGIATARLHGLEATGTLGVLELAATFGLIDLPAALTPLIPAVRSSYRFRP